MVGPLHFRASHRPPKNIAIKEQSPTVHLFPPLSLLLSRYFRFSMVPICGPSDLSAHHSLSSLGRAFLVGGSRSRLARIAKRVCTPSSCSMAAPGGRLHRHFSLN